MERPLRNSGFACSILLVTIASLAAGCSSDGTDNNHPGTIALTVNPTTGTAAQNGQVVTTATLTRGDGFTGTVTLTVTGAPLGVAAGVANVQTNGTTTTGTVTIAVGSAAAVGSYTITVHGVPTLIGVIEATATYTLTVTARPGVHVSLSTTSPSITLGSATLTATSNVLVTRTNFQGNVTLSVDNLPTGVTASFAPANPQTAGSSVLTLTAGPTAVAGIFSNMAVRATGTGIDPFTADFTLTLVPPAAAPRAHSQ